MPQHIGIVGCSAEGASLCYRTICVEGAALLGPHAHPEVSMHTPSLADYTACLYRDDWLGVGDLMLASAEKLARIGAGFLICPDNTIHQAMPHVLPRSPLPWLHIAEVVAQGAAERGFRHLGLTGTRWLVDSEVWTSGGRAWPSATRSTASSWTNWSAAYSGRRRLRPSSGSSAGCRTMAATRWCWAAPRSR